jgi:hypothetical protein
MRVSLPLLVFVALFPHSLLRGQSSSLELQAGLGYARAFDGAGISFAAALERPLSDTASRVQHALGGSLWYSEMSVGSAPSSAPDRRMLGIGVRYQLELRNCCGQVRPFLALPLQLMQSSVPESSTLPGTGGLLAGRVPEPDPPVPPEDQPGTDWGWGTGLEIGFRVNVSGPMSAHSSAQALYNRIYESGTRHWGWTWHAGLSYALQGS